MKKYCFFAIIAIAVVLTSCGPYKAPRWKNIGTNETAFVIPLEQGTKEGQKTFKSIEYLEAKKVAAKRIYIEQIAVSTGYMWWSYVYIPTDTVIVVHRSPVTREWTKGNSTGTSSQNQVLNVASKESIGFDVPVNCTGSVLEEDASKFLYHFGGQTIEWVMDHNVRPYILDYLTIEFGKKKLDKCQDERNDVYITMKETTVKFFKGFGLTIINLGVAGEFTYTKSAIQDAIDSKFISQMKIAASLNEVDAANNFSKAGDAIRKQKELDADINIKNSFAKAISEGNLTWPATLVIGQGMTMMDIWGLNNMNTSAPNSPVVNPVSKTGKK